jgi:hypothetical protein
MTFRQRIISSPTVATLVSGVVLLLAGSSAGVETATVDFDITEGSANHPIATGWLGALSDLVPDTLVLPLKPSYIRDVPPPDPHHPGDPGQHIWDRAESVGVMTGGVTLIVPVAGRWDWTTPYPSLEDYGWDGFWKNSLDCQNGTQLYAYKLHQWTDHVHLWVAWAESMRVANGRQHVLVQYNLTNEPDIWGVIDPCTCDEDPDPRCSCVTGWHPATCWGDPDTLFLKIWNATVDSIRSWVPGAVIEGPDFAFSVKGKPPSPPGAPGLTMDKFLKYCDDHGCLPDVLAWHDLGYSDPTDPDMGAAEHFGGPTPDLTWNLYTQVYYATTLNAADSLSHPISHYEINEMLDRPFSLIPGIMVREFALAERAKTLGLMFAGRTYWCDPCEACTSGGASSQGGRLAGLIQPTADNSCGGGTKYLGKRYAWWVNKAYADLTGNYVNVSSTDSLDGLAAINLQSGVARVLLGRYLGAPETDVRLVLKNLGTSLVVNDAVHVVMKHMPRDSADVRPQAPEAPLVISDSRLPVYGDSVVVTVPEANFRPGDALSIEVTRIVPGTTIARGE